MAASKIFRSVYITSSNSSSRVRHPDISGFLSISMRRYELADWRSFIEPIGH